MNLQPVQKFKQKSAGSKKQRNEPEQNTSICDCSQPHKFYCKTEGGWRIHGLLGASWRSPGRGKSTRAGHDSIKLLQAPLFDQIMRKALRVQQRQAMRCNATSLVASPLLAIQAAKLIESNEKMDVFGEICIQIRLKSALWNFRKIYIFF